MGLAKLQSLKLLHMLRYRIRASMGTSTYPTQKYDLCFDPTSDVSDHLWYYVHIKGLIYKLKKYKDRNIIWRLTWAGIWSKRTQYSSFLWCPIPYQKLFWFHALWKMGKTQQKIFFTYLMVGKKNLNVINLWKLQAEGDKMPWLG